MDRLNDLGFNFEFQSTLPVRGATQRIMGSLEVSSISIHAPREGSDPGTEASVTNSGTISIHAPREGSDSFRLLRRKSR